MSHTSKVSRTSTFAYQAALNKAKGTKVRPKFRLNADVKVVLHCYANGNGADDYQNMVLSIRDSEMSDEDILGVLVDANECLPLLTRKLHLFVESVLSIRWADRRPEVVSEYQSFLLNLLSAHNYHTRVTLDMLVKNFVPDVDEQEWTDGVPSDEDCRKYVNVHWVFNSLMHMIPIITMSKIQYKLNEHRTFQIITFTYQRCKEILLETFASQYPYINKSPHTHEVYVHNLLWVLEYEPKFRLDILRLIISKLILLDVNAPKEEIERLQNEEVFSFDESFSSSQNNFKQGISRSLDICMDKLFNYFISECYDDESGNLVWDKTKGIYHDMLLTFEELILPTYNPHHVQYTMFLICSFRTVLTEAFLNYLWKKASAPTEVALVRQSAIFYMASLIARGSFVPLPVVKATLEQMAGWIHSYILSQDGNEYVNCNLRSHLAFYTMCQSLFYVIAFRNKDLVNCKKNIAFLSNLNLPKIVTCKLNPLRVCQPAIVQNFAAVARNYQLAYCYTVMEHNSRNVLPVIYQDDRGLVTVSNETLEAVFPFDPYMLKRSNSKIKPFYVNYQKADGAASCSKSTHQQQKEHDEDDFLGDQGGDTKQARTDFSYSTSPGFRQRL